MHEMLKYERVGEHVGLTDKHDIGLNNPLSDKTLEASLENAS